MSEENRLQINWISSAGGALGAVSSAVVLSTFGVAGTLIGAAVGSLCISVGGALYAHSLRLTKERMEVARLAAIRSRARAHGNPAAELAANRQIEEVEDAGVTPARESRIQALRELPWKRIGAGTVALFLVAMAIIVAFELKAGRPVSTFTGGSDSDQRTSVPRLGGRGGDSDKDDPGQKEQPDSPDESEQPTPDDTSPTPEPTVPTEETPTTPAPTTPVPTETAPSPLTPSPEPTDPTPDTEPAP